ncbi:MAG: uracil-DNA glycosylase family protein [Verrucomicrobiota bacterium]
MPSEIAKGLIEAARSLTEVLGGLRFGPPVTHLYNPLRYAAAAHAEYLTRFGDSKKRVLFLGMNPGPYGMAQTGVPFGEVAAVRDWMGIECAVARPENEHPKRPIQGFACARSEVSGRRLWGFFGERFPRPEDFFRDHFVANYCPLVWMEASGRNRTPDKLPVSEREPVEAACDAHLLKVVEWLDPEWVVGVGGFAEKRLEMISDRSGPRRRGRILHPSPASPAANRDWAGTAHRQLKEQGIWG